MTARSCSWWWCFGCGRWHAPDRSSGFHRSLVSYGPEPPDEQNFEGTPEELARFIACRELGAEDDLAFERRITERLRLENLERQGLLPGR